MEEMTWWEIIGDQLGWFKWCQHCYRMRWFHRHGVHHGPQAGSGKANSAICRNEGVQYTMHPKMARKLASYRRRQTRRATA
jgi:hypothetical protein